MDIASKWCLIQPQIRDEMKKTTLSPVTKKVKYTVRVIQLETVTLLSGEPGLLLKPLYQFKTPCDTGG